MFLCCFYLLELNARRVGSFAYFYTLPLKKFVEGKDMKLFGSMKVEENELYVGGVKASALSKEYGDVYKRQLSQL